MDIQEEGESNRNREKKEGEKKKERKKKGATNSQQNKKQKQKTQDKIHFKTSGEQRCTLGPEPATSSTLSPQ